MQARYILANSAHSLNLCGVHAMETSTEIKTYFGNVQKLYNVFVCSPARRKVLQEYAGVSLHNISATRWSAHIDAVRALTRNYKGILSALNQMYNELDLPAEVQADVSGLTEWLQSFEFVLLSTIWIKILCIGDRNKMLQNSKTSLEEVAHHLKSLLAEIELLKDPWERLIDEAKIVAEGFGVRTDIRKSRNGRDKNFHDEAIDNEHTFDSVNERFKVEVLIPAMDKLLLDLQNLYENIQKLCNFVIPVISPPTNAGREDIACFAEELGLIASLSHYQ
ncbi:hypothetical protein PR048_012624 [Dryococelus australis]|uniref:Zinc finger BED domain-containing protein 4 n=1 Tax=Dryococelus australis TaxID=614101 RepID=A0ABQ9HPW7_9NEOP|nr:hypothetical protein PR048_012624 [Dryococelus australis]